MKKKDYPGSMQPAMAKPSAHVSWPSKGIRLSGDWKGLALGKRACVIVEGEVTGFSMQEYGCSVDLDPDTVRIDKLEAGRKGTLGKPLAELIDKKA